MNLVNNEHNYDRIARIVLALVIFAAGLAAQSWLGLLGFIFLATGLIGYCPLYQLFGISTCPVKSK